MKKGFTLAELLGVIVILSLIALITVPAITDTLQNYKIKLCNTQLEEIISAAKTWGADNLVKLPSSEGQTKTVSLKMLSDYGYIDAVIQNPVTKENFELETTTVTITKQGKKFVYTLDEDTTKSCTPE